MCREATHLAWLGNVLDRAALTYLCKSGEHLYQEDLASCVQELFADLLKPEEGVNDEAIAMSDDEAS